MCFTEGESVISCHPKPPQWPKTKSIQLNYEISHHWLVLRFSNYKTWCKIKRSDINQDQAVTEPHHWVINLRLAYVYIYLSICIRKKLHGGEAQQPQFYLPHSVCYKLMQHSSAQESIHQNSMKTIGAVSTCFKSNFWGCNFTLPIVNRRYHHINSSLLHLDNKLYL